MVGDVQINGHQPESGQGRGNDRHPAGRSDGRETPDVESSSPQYAERFAGEIGRYFLETQTRIFLKLLEPLPGRCVLDVGGGHAQLAGPLVDRGYQYTALGSPGASRERLDRVLGPQRYEYVSGSLLDLPFPDESFDHVLAFRMLPHLRAWPRLIQEMCRVARCGVLLDYPDRRSLNALTGALFWAKKAAEQTTRSYRLFKRSDLKGAFRDQGFGKTRFTPQFFLPMVVYRMLGSAKLARGAEAPCPWIALTKNYGSPVIVRATRLERRAQGDGPS